MHILFTRFPLESAFGGAEIQTIALAKGLRDKGHTVSFLGSCPTLLREFNKEGFDVCELDIGPPPVTKWRAISFLWRGRKVKRKLVSEVMKRSGSEVIMMLSLTEKLLLTDWAVKKGMKVFWIEHDRIGRWLSMNPWLPKLKKLSRSVTTITVSDLSKDLYVKLGWRPENIIAVPNGIDVEKFHREKDIVGSPFRLGCIARLSHEKGVDLLLEAIKGLPDIALIIVGRGPQEKALQALISKLNLGDRVNITPDIPREDLYKDMDALVLPSRDHDPFGLVVAEAMSAGVPTILTNVCGIASHLHSGEALIVKATAKDLKKAIEEVQDEQVWKALANMGPAVARERFSVAKMVEAYEELNALY